MLFSKPASASKNLTFKLLCLSATLGILHVPASLCYAAEPSLNFKVYSPQEPPQAESAEVSAPATTGDPAMEPAEAINTDVPSDKTAGGASSPSIFEEETPKIDLEKAEKPAETKVNEVEQKAQETQAESGATTTAATDSSAASTGSVLQGYVRSVPVGTHIPIIMDTAVDSDTSQEGDEFSARTSEDLAIDGATVVPARSIIHGRIAQMMAPRALNRSGAVQLKFDTITTPDNRQIPLVANIVARGGVVHAKRGFKDVLIDSSAVTLPLLAGLGIGALAGGGSSSSSIGAGGGAMIGAGIGLAVGVAVLLAKKGKKIDVRPGDELKIELAEELRMPAM